MTFSAEQKMQLLFALRSKGVTDTAVLEVIEKIDRGLFVRGLFADRDKRTCPFPSNVDRQFPSLLWWAS